MRYLVLCIALMSCEKDPVNTFTVINKTGETMYSAYANIYAQSDGGKVVFEEHGAWLNGDPQNVIASGESGTIEARGDLSKASKYFGMVYYTSVNGVVKSVALEGVF